MIVYALMLSCLAVFSAGEPVPREISCPALPCPLPPCSDPVPTYYMHDGKNCTGCPQCVRCPFLPCPLPPCDDPEPTYYMYHGKNCTGCSQCPMLLDVDGVGKRQDSLAAVDFNVCPDVSCAFVERCPVPLVLSHFTVGNTVCPGCPFCPVSITPDPLTG